MTVRQMMLYTETEMSSIHGFIVSDEHVIEQKFDGTRALIVVKDGKVDFLARNGRPLTHSAAMQHFDSLRTALGSLMKLDDAGELVLDGEIMIRTGELYLFDLPYLRAGGLELIQPSDAFYKRRKALESVRGTLEMFYRLNPGHEQKIKVVRQAKTPSTKRDVWLRAQAENVEGVMVKRLDAPYEPGRRAKSGLKIKFVKTADVVVMDSSRSRNEAGREIGAFTFGIYDPGNPKANDADYVVFGSCSAIGKPDAQIGDVIEVAYLYREDGGGSLVQPRMVRIREDKNPVDCTFEQFPAYSRKEV